MLVALMLYYIYRLMRDSRSLNVFSGIMVFVVIWLLVSQVLQMRLLGSILDKLVSVGVIALIVLFQDDIRKFLYNLGAHRRIRSIIRFLSSSKDKAKEQKDVKETIKDDSAKAPKVYYVVSFGDMGDFTCGGDTFIHEIITAAGGDNIAKDVTGWSYTQEKLIEADPDIIIIPEWAESSFSTTAPYSDLRAVKEGHVYAINTDALDRQGPRNADAVEMLAKLFYPEAFTEEKAA